MLQIAPAINFVDAVKWAQHDAFLKWCHGLHPKCRRFWICLLLSHCASSDVGGGFWNIRTWLLLDFGDNENTSSFGVLIALWIKHSYWKWPFCSKHQCIESPFPEFYQVKFMEDNQASTTVMHTGNSSTMRYANKTQNICFKWMKQQFEEEQFDLINVGTDWQTADILTKPEHWEVLDHRRQEQAIYSWFTHNKWWFSIVMLFYQRVDCNRETSWASTSAMRGLSHIQLGHIDYSLPPRNKHPQENVVL